MRGVSVFALCAACLPLWIGIIAGCGPSESVAKPGVQPTAPLTRDKQALRREPKPVVARPLETLPEFVPPFEARANPFAPPKPAQNERVATTGDTETLNVKLIGVMNDGDKPMAAVRIDGQRRIVFAGMELGSATDAGILQILEIHEFEIVVEQSGKQWVVALPGPETARTP
ncbi:MAG: hypothetical protein O7B26_03255 [Planctomycetota bacterium]|nr:hypothetical protein [Planctomycetota bacterium]